MEQKVGHETHLTSSAVYGCASWIAAAVYLNITCHAYSLVTDLQHYMDAVLTSSIHAPSTRVSLRPPSCPLARMGIVASVYRVYIYAWSTCVRNYWLSRPPLRAHGFLQPLAKSPGSAELGRGKERHPHDTLVEELQADIPFCCSKGRLIGCGNMRAENLSIEGRPTCMHILALAGSCGSRNCESSEN